MLVAVVFQLFDCNYTLYKTDTSVQEAVEKHFLIPTLHGREWRTVVQLVKLVREVELQEQVSKHSWMEDGLWWNETTVHLGAINTTPGWLSILSLLYSSFHIFLSIFFFYMISKRHFISFHSLRNEFIQVFNGNEMLVLMPISFRYHINWKRTLFWIENQTSCRLGWVAHEYLIWRENHARENALNYFIYYYYYFITWISFVLHSGTKLIPEWK